MAVRRSVVVDWLMKINLLCGALSGIAMLLMMIVGALDVIGTNLDLVGLPSTPVPAAFEFVATMMVVSVFLAVSLSQARREHIRVEVLVDKLPRPLRQAADVLRYGLSMAFFMAIAYYGALSAMRSYGVGEYAPGLINFPVWPARVVLAFGASLISIQCAIDLIGVFSRRFTVPDRVGGAQTPPSIG